MLVGSELASALTRLPNTPFSGVLFRVANLDAILGIVEGTSPFPEPRLLGGLGSPTTGARFTRRNGPNSLYLADEPTTAFEEVRKNLEPSGQKTPPPMVTYTVKTQLASVLDISKTEIQETLATTLDELKAPWRLSQTRGETVPTQTLGQAVFDSGRYEAIRFPSAKVPGKTCVVIFVERLHPPSFIEIYDPHDNLQERIPRHTE